MGDFETRDAISPSLGNFFQFREDRKAELSSTVFSPLQAFVQLERVSLNRVNL